MPERAARRLRRLAEELDESGLRELAEWLDASGRRLDATDPLREMLVEEIDHALRPTVHERRVASGGTIIEPLSDPATWGSRTQLEITHGPVDQPLSAARR